MIEVKALCKDFSLSSKQKKELQTQADSIRVVDNVSFACQPGRVFSLLGPNGAGKTTTLRMISSILKPSSGQILIAGHDNQKEAQLARKKIGFLTGSTGLYDRLTANEVVKYFADLFDVPKSDFQARKKYLFDLMDMNGFANKKCGQLSTGMKQKVSIARTLIHAPEVVVFDEPTSGLDVITAENIIQLVSDLKNEGKTVIFSSHIMSEVDLLADDIAIIHKGKVLFNDTMEAFRKGMQAENLTKEFIRVVKSGGQA